MKKITRKNSVTLVPTRGLCNRMFTIKNAIALCSKYPEAQYRILWENNKDCMADFSDLFEKINQKRIDIVPLNNFIDRPSYHPIIWPATYLRWFRYKYQINRSRQLDVIQCVGNDNSYIVCNCGFCDTEFKEPLSSVFVPTKEIEERICKVTSLFSRETIGVHIRRTDNVACINNSPLENFYVLLDELIGNNPNVKFYVSSDDTSIKSLFHDKYGGHIITCDWNLKRNSLEGIKDAVAELFCLAKTSRIIGSSNSSYAMMASLINEIEFIDANNKN